VSVRDPVELVALYAAGLLSSEERVEFDRLLLAKDPALLAELERVRPLLDASVEGDAIEPPASVRSAVLASIEPERAGAGAVAAGGTLRAMLGRAGARGGAEVLAAGVIVDRGAGGKWRRVGLPGVMVKTLFSDRRAGRETLLVKCEPGAYIPEHGHGGIEELLVLEGDLTVGETRLGPGDYFRAMPGSAHGDVRSPSGCVCLLFSSSGTITATTRAGMFVRVIGEVLRRIFGR
jgi:anti-sigma factor ChrR (cupin superfamily)